MKAVRDGHWSRPSSDLGVVGMMAFLNFCQTLMVAIQVVCSPKKGQKARKAAEGTGTGQAQKIRVEEHATFCKLELELDRILTLDAAKST